MAFTSGFFNSYKGDRKYNAEQVSEIFDGVLADGIIPSQGQLFDVNTANNGMQITIGTGRAWFDHTWSKNDSVMVLTVEVSDITRPRYDTVVLEVNHEDDVRQNSIKIIKGVAAVNADKPILLNTDKVKQYPLAHILVRAGTDEIRAADIENMVGRSPTVFATGILETAPLDDLWSQWKGEWEDWFANIKLQLSGDIVTNLQYQIDQLKEQCLLSNETKALMGFDSKSTNDDAINYILTMLEMIAKGKAMAIITIKYSDGTPAVGVQVNGMQTKSGSAVYTNDRGIATGLINSGSVTLTTQGYTDLNAGSHSYSVTSGETITDTWTISFIEFISIASTRNISFSPLIKTVDVALCGGGGGGGRGNYLSSGCGGGGGYVTTKTGISVVSGQSYSIVVGAGGIAGGTGPDWNYSKPETMVGGTGGSSSAFGVTASGGSGGTYSNASGENAYQYGGSGNGKGGDGRQHPTGTTVFAYNGNPGTAATQSVYASINTTQSVGGGGGSGAYVRQDYVYSPVSATGGSGGSPYGGKGGSVSASESTISSKTEASSGSGYGGGGGGSYCAYRRNTGTTVLNGVTQGNAASGSGGIVTIRMHH